jgi:GT2 family glycosyltransferase
MPDGDPTVEVFVVDNNSVDGSVDMVQAKFPDVHVIANHENLGFSKANNQAIQRAKGDYILLLNPDTVVEEETFAKVIKFMDDHEDAGGLGVKMLDGKGKFLPESKRSFPSPWVAFTKMTGLSRLFPKSSSFSQYHLGYLPEDEVNEVDVLSGAFMVLRKTAIDQVGMLDEDFFMYGEDIDLSYRIKQGGFKNYYYPETRIIHYKGESTKKGSLNYLRMFYNAMIIFARKHLQDTGGRAFIGFIKVAIYIRALIAFLNSLVGKAFLPLADGLLMYGGMYWLADFWGSNIKGASSYYPPEYLYVNVPLYILLWISAIYLSGGYDRPRKAYRLVRGLVAGTVVIAAVYGFLEEEYRFSRAMIVVGAAMSVFLLMALRMFLYLFRTGKMGLDEAGDKRLVIVGSKGETSRVLSLLNQTNAEIEYIGYIADDEEPGTDFLGRTDQISEIREMYRIDEIVFCSKDVSSASIMEMMTIVGPELDFKIVPEESGSIIGSNSKNEAGDLYAFDINPDLATSMGRRNKRLYDLLALVVLTLLSPLVIWVMRRPFGFLGNLFSVLFGTKTWVGYVESARHSTSLPKIRKGVLPVISNEDLDPAMIDRLNFLYAKDYSAANDARIMLTRFRYLGS